MKPFKSQRESLREKRVADGAAAELLKSGSAPLVSPRRIAQLIAKRPQKPSR